MSKPVQHLLYIDGHWRAGSNGETLAVIDSASEAMVGELAVARGHTKSWGCWGFAGRVAFFGEDLMRKPVWRVKLVTDFSDEAGFDDIDALEPMERAAFPQRPCRRSQREARGLVQADLARLPTADRQSPGAACRMKTPRLCMLPATYTGLTHGRSRLRRFA